MYFYQKIITKLKFPFISSILLAVILSCAAVKKVAVIAGVTAALFTVLVVIACGCPDVYLGDTFQGNLYSGSITPSLERDDFIVLETSTENKDSIEINMANNKNEHLYTNKLEIIEVVHPADVSILPDQLGDIYSIRQLVSPASAFSANIDQLENISSKDEKVYMFDAGENKNHLKTLNLVFDKPKYPKTGKLVLSVKNSNWFNAMFDEMCSLWGDKYDKQYNKMWNDSTSMSMATMAEQGVYINVYVKLNHKWELVDHIKTVGSTIFKDVLVPINLEKHEGNRVEVKLTSGHKFWDINYVGIDYSKSAQLETKYISPISAVDSIGTDQLDEVLADDTLYMEQSRVGHNITVIFPLSDKQQSSTLILHGKGHYKRLDKYSGNTKYMTLLSLRKKGGMSSYSKGRHDDYNKFLKAQAKK